MRSFENKTIMVIGARGYIGSSFVNYLKNKYCNIIRIGRDPKIFSPIRKTIANVEDIELNFNSKEYIDAVRRSNVIFYFSAQTSTYTAEKDILKDYEDSVSPIVKLLSLCEKLSTKPTLIFSSAVTICGLVEKLPVNETFKDNPITIYDIHKLTIEQYIKFYAKKNIIKGCILRLSNVYGPGVNSSSSDRGILNLMIKKALNGENLTLYGSGEFLRDYIYIDDVISAFAHAYFHIDNETNGKCYVLGTGIKKSIKNAFDIIVKKSQKIVSNNVLIESVSMPTKISDIEYRNFIADSSCFCSETNWKAKVNLESGIEKTMNNFKKLIKE
ncbi:NAD-dependent epimerase/dehydratase [Arcobacter nitrofigilis DSM 7299]|uniref:NAD-dependent epimerase/dehydratase n=1 Tax=Arcobacter nitrofigilis (strain ATCC 33309 / DSM 7299 / CCUG 15893 / LMG 7604 / NCTC 12251 / CI) TaxID=572480 RepID=D5V6D4_ARCNC|nr:NAD-dependent epimerase/dehydratase family protein [Arcobacter nitrofigilis]ADG94204.1 NAD-dependent epimerase/dehydratase [Arcobacter nitrofigilis DSM 7299]